MRARIPFDTLAIRQELEPLATKEALQAMERRLTLRFGAMLAAAVAFVVALIKLL